MANQKVTALTALAEASADDLFYIVDDPSGTPISKKITRTNLLRGDGYYDNGNSGATLTIDLDNGNYQAATLTDNCTFTFSNPVSTGASQFVLILTQDNVGSRTVTWPSSVDWAEATAPTLSTGIGSIDIFTFFTIDGGTIWYGFTAGLSMG